MAYDDLHFVVTPVYFVFFVVISAVKVLLKGRFDPRMIVICCLDRFRRSFACWNVMAGSVLQLSSDGKREIQHHTMNRSFTDMYVLHQENLPAFIDHWIRIIKRNLRQICCNDSSRLLGTISIEWIVRE